METLIEKLPDPPIERRIGAASSSTDVQRIVRPFQFQLFQKQTQLGDVRIDQFWMHTRGLYGERNQHSRNREAIIDYFWRKCFAESTIAEKAVQQSYILAKLLPHARSSGSQRVFVDASLARSKRESMDKKAMAAELEELLKSSFDEELTEVEFRNRTADLLGPPVYDESIWRRYWEFVEEILERNCRVLEEEGERGLHVALDTWTQMMRTIGRRRGNKTDKQVLDILSYEARAALHRCYSAVWFDLLPVLQSKYALNSTSKYFHRLWHFDIQRPAAETDQANFHLFHGSIFGLHPACGNFMLTKTGPQLIGQWAAQPRNVTYYQRLLHGLFIAMHQYASRHQIYALLRKKDACSVTVSDMVALEEQLEEEKRGQRNHRRKKSDL